jgi:DNA polymerase III gamma/tau subunit
MELLLEQCEHNKSEEPCEECAPKIEKDENMDLYEYDYYKRIWF